MKTGVEIPWWDRDGWNRAWTRGTAGLLWISVAATVAVLVLSAPRCLENTDEASWVLCAANPWASPGWGIHFGFGLHPLWWIGGEVAGFRVAGIFALLGAGLIFSLALIRAGPALGAGNMLRRYAWILLPSLAVAVLHRYSIGTRTPSYDWLLLAASLLLAAGWLGIITEQDKKKSWLAGTVASLGLVLAGVAKWVVLPGYLVLLGTLVVAEPASSRRRILSVLGVGTFGWSILFVAYATPKGILDTIQAGFAQLGSGSHQNLFSHYLVGFLKGSWQVIRAYPWVAALFAGLWLLFWALGRGKKPAAIHVAGFTFLAGLVLAGCRGHLQGGLETFSKGLMIGMVWLTGVYAMCRPYAYVGGTEKKRRDDLHLKIVAMWMVLPLLNGMGTATGITDYLVHGSVFYAAVGWIFLGRALTAGLPPWCMASAVLMLGILHASRAVTSTQQTFRSGSVWVDLAPVSTGPERGKLYLPDSNVRELEELRLALDRMGYREGDPIVGLTDLCGLVYLLGGVSPGVVWYMGFWLPENQGVRKNLEHIPPEVLARTWFLVRGRVKPHERLENVWPSDSGLPLPGRSSKAYGWSWEQGGGSPDPIYVYPPRKAAF